MLSGGKIPPPMGETSQAEHSRSLETLVPDSAHDTLFSLERPARSPLLFILKCSGQQGHEGVWWNGKLQWVSVAGCLGFLVPDTLDNTVVENGSPLGGD